MSAPEALSPDENFLALDREWSDPDSAGVVVLQAPFERTSTFGLGSARGPEAIIAASHEVELFDAALGCEPYRAARGIATLPPLAVPDAADGALIARTLRDEVKRWRDRGKFVVVLGGEHTSTVGAAQAVCETVADLTVLQLDAHSDLRPDYQDDPWNHACHVARILDFHDVVVQVGIRSQAREERECAEARAIPVFHAHDIARWERVREDWIGRVIDALRPNVHVTFDCDIFDPAVIPATGTPEPGGLDWWQIDALFERLARERTVVGLDVTELAPIEGLAHPQFTIAKLVYRIIGRVFGG